MEFTWLDALIYPKETFRAEKERASLGEAIKNVGVAGLIGGVIRGLFVGLEVAFGGVTFLIIALILGIIILPIVCIIVFLLCSLIYFIFANILGSKGNFTTQTYLISLFTAPLIILSLLEFIPSVGWVLGILIILYSLYPLTIALRESHGFSTARAILAWLIPWLIIVLLLSMISPIVIMV